MNLDPPTTDQQDWNPFPSMIHLEHCMRTGTSCIIQSLKEGGGHRFFEVQWRCICRYQPLPERESKPFSTIHSARPCLSAQSVHEHVCNVHVSLREG
jgi:hypothetical protein